MNGKRLVWIGNSMTVIALIVFVWLAWTQELQPLWLQRQDLNEFMQTPTPVKVQPSPTAIATIQKNNTSVTLAETKIPTPMVTPSPTLAPVIKTNYLLEIPSIKLKWIVHHITPDEVTNDPWGIRKSYIDAHGVVDYPHLQYPGEKGLVAIAGHSDIDGNPFWYLYDVKIGDYIYITRKDGVKLSYVVYRTVTVVPDDPVFWDSKYPYELRLVSCLIGSTQKRIMIFAYQLN